jgi:orotidine-5'-phosphate decarboxylase
MVNDPPVIVALDLSSAEEAVRLAKAVAPYVGGFKVGIGLLYGPGPGTIATLAALGKPVFADAKVHDIPSQVEMATRRLAGLGARWITAHVSGGEDMLRAAVAGATAGSGGVTGILGVTVLTSLDEQALTAVGINASPGKLVSRMARVASAAGCEGIVCSPQELGVVAAVAPDLIPFTPGIRPSDSAHHSTDREAGPSGDDQKRVSAPADALARGAVWLVVGRPITAAPDPVAAAAKLAAQLAEQVSRTAASGGDATSGDGAHGEEES